MSFSLLVLAPVNCILTNTLQFLSVFFTAFKGYLMNYRVLQYNEILGLMQASKVPWARVTIKILSLMLLPTDGMLKSYMILKGNWTKLRKRYPLTNNKHIENKISYRSHETGNSVRTLRARVSPNRGLIALIAMTSLTEGALPYMLFSWAQESALEIGTVWISGVIFDRQSPELSWVSCSCLYNG